MSALGERIFLPLDLRMLILHDCDVSQRQPATLILNIITEYYKERLPSEVYQELKERYAMSVFEQRKVKELRREEREKRKSLKQKKIEARISELDNQIQTWRQRINDGETSFGKYDPWEEIQRLEEEKRKLLESEVKTA